MSKEKELQKRTGVYIGRRLTSKNKIAHFWIFNDTDGKPGGYIKQIAPASIGEHWSFTFEGKSLYTRGEHGPKRTGDLERDRAPWVAEDQIAYQHDLDRKAEQKLKARRTEFDHALEHLRLLVLSVKGFDNRDALIRRIATELRRT